MHQDIDALFHPAFLDPRYTIEQDVYELHPAPERGELKGGINYAPDRAFDILHTKLELTIDQEEGEVSGRATIVLRPFAAGITDVELQAARMSFSRVAIKRGRTFETLPRIKTFDDHIHIALPRPFAATETLTLQLDYTCRPRTGLHFIRKDEAYPSNPQQIWSQGQDTDSHHWFPCVDHPSEKMTTEIILTVRDDQIALSNGRLVKIKTNRRAKTKTYHYHHEHPHPAYLVSIVIGDYAELCDVYEACSLRYYVYHDRVGDAPALFQKTPKMIKHFSRLFRYDFPYPKYDQVIVSEFLFGAMENTTTTTISDRALLNQHAAQDASNEDLIAHELAHQWWGDIVTCKDWSHLWLNEGFATYCEALFMEADEGEDEARFKMLQEYNLYFTEDRSRYRRPIVTNRWKYITEMFDRHSYQKGGLVLDMLRFVLGDELFFASLSHYLRKFEWQNAETSDLRRAIEEVSGQNLEWFFDQWLYKGGHPEFAVSQSYDRKQKLLRVQVRQLQKTDALTPLFQMPVDIEVHGKNGSRTFRVRVDRAEQEFIFQLSSEPLAINFDRGNRIVKTLHFERPKEDLLYLLKKSTDVTARIRAARDLGKFIGDDTVNALQDALAKDSFWGVKVAAAVALSDLKTEAALAALRAAYGKATDARVRRACVWAMGVFKTDLQSFEELTVALQTDSSLFVAMAAVRAIGNSSHERAFEVIRQTLERETFQDYLRMSCFDALVFRKEKRGIDVAMEWSEGGRPQGARVAALVAMAALAHHFEDERPRVIERLAEALQDRSPRVRLVATRSLGRTGDKSVIPLLRNIEINEAIVQIKLAAHRALSKLEEP